MRRKQKEDGTKEIVLPGTKRASSPPVGADRSDEVEEMVRLQQESFNEVFQLENVQKKEIESTVGELGEKIEAELNNKQKPKSSFERIITYQFQAVNDEEEYQYLVSKLSFENRVSAMSYGQLVDELDLAENHAFRAVQLKARAHLAKEEYERDTKIIESSLRPVAKKALEDQKVERKARDQIAGKAITNADVDAEMASLFPDEWALIRTRTIQAEQSLKIYDALAERWCERAKDLRQMVYSTRATD